MCMDDIQIATADRHHVDGIAALLNQVQRKHFQQYPGRFETRTMWISGLLFRPI